MNSSSPREFLTLPTGETDNYSEVFGTISHGEFEDYLEGEDSPSVEGSLTEDQLERVLRAVDVEQNGRYSQSEFLSLVKRIHVLTPEEVIEGHVNQLKLSNKRSKS